MLQIGDYVVKANYGVCRIKGIQSEKISDNLIDYFVLIPLKEKGAQILIPVNRANKSLRKAMDEEQAEKVRNLMTAILNWQNPVCIVNWHLPWRWKMRT